MNKSDPSYKTHIRHCNQGEYEGSCKYGDSDCPAIPKNKPKRRLNMNEFVKEYQCIGCTSGGIGCFSKSEADLSCKKHSPGTVLLGAGTIMLGMPKGFNRLGPAENANISIFETYEDFMKEYANIKTKYCVPVWRYVNKDKHTFLRIYNPRINIAEIIIILEDCSKEFTCIEITQEDINFMD
jgi:hypothetical protein